MKKKWITFFIFSIFLLLILSRKELLPSSQRIEKLKLKKIDEEVIGSDGVILNNINISRKKSLSGKEYVNFEASLRNKNDVSKDVAVFIVCYSSSGKVVCCASLKPMFDTIEENKNDSLKGDFYIEEGDFATISSVDVRLVVR